MNDGNTRGGSGSSTVFNRGILSPPMCNTSINICFVVQITLDLQQQFFSADADILADLVHLGDGVPQRGYTGEAPANMMEVVACGNPHADDVVVGLRSSAGRRWIVYSDNRASVRCSWAGGAGETDGCQYAHDRTAYGGKRSWT